MHEPVRVRTADARSTFALGRRIGKTLKKGTVVALTGPLGAGKTVLTKGIASALGVKDIIVSPTFTLINEYSGKLPFYHFDLYRLNNLSEMECLGTEEYFEGSGVCVVEWADKFPEIIPPKSMRVTLEHAEKGARICTIENWKRPGKKRK
jgi:tRNA threonylcarbamoyladenosine biosynthesis protein TsaE